MKDERPEWEASGAGERAGIWSHGRQGHSPVKYPAFDSIPESIQGDVVLHEGFHFLLVCHEERGIKCATAFGNGETNDATASTKF